MISALLVSIPVLAVVSLVVFGGGQIFMPLFQIYWDFINKVFHTTIAQETIDTVFAVGNGTPGVLSTKFAFVSGYLMANGEWYGYLAAFLTFFSFVTPAILLMYVAMKISKKYAGKTMGVTINKYMKPVVGGIMIALVIQLFIGSMFQNFSFNEQSMLFGGSYATVISDNKTAFFSGYRLYILIAWVCSSFVYSYVLYKKKFPIYALILMNIVIALLLFHPFV